MIHDEITYNGRILIIDTAFIQGGPGCLNTYETMAMWADNSLDIDCMRTHDLYEAERNHAAMLSKYKGQEDAPLTGKYAKLRDDIAAALTATEHLENTEDGGTCNFDSPALFLPRWNGKKVKQAAEEAGAGAWKWDLWGLSRWVISFRSSGQANRRSRRSESLVRVLSGMGYDCTEYCQAD